MEFADEQKKQTKKQTKQYTGWGPEGQMPPLICVWVLTLVHVESKKGGSGQWCGGDSG